MKKSLVFASTPSLLLASFAVLLSGIIWLQTRVYAEDSIQLMSICGNSGVADILACGQTRTTCEAQCDSLSGWQKTYCIASCKDAYTSCAVSGNNGYDACAQSTSSLRRNPFDPATMNACDIARQDRDNCNLIYVACLEGSGGDPDLQTDCGYANNDCWAKSGVQMCE